MHKLTNTIKTFYSFFNFMHFFIAGYNLVWSRCFCGLHLLEREQWTMRFTNAYLLIMEEQYTLTLAAMSFSIFINYDYYCECMSIIWLLIIQLRIFDSLASSLCHSTKKGHARLISYFLFFFLLKVIDVSYKRIEFRCAL